MALYRVAQICWALPLLVGVGILPLYAITSADILEVAGSITLAAGIWLCGIGVVCLLVFKPLLRRCDSDVRQCWTPRSSVLLGLLVLNVPAAMVCAGAGVWLMQRYTVVVVNSSGADLGEVSIVNGRKDD